MSRFEAFMRHFVSTRMGKAVGGGIVLVIGVLIFLGQQSLGVFVGAVGLIILIWSLMAEPSEPDSENSESSSQRYQPNEALSPEMLAGQKTPSVVQYPAPSGQLPFSRPQAGIEYGQPQYIAPGYHPQAAQEPSEGPISPQQHYGNDGRQPQGLFARYGHPSASQVGTQMPREQHYGQ